MTTSTLRHTNEQLNATAPSGDGEICRALQRALRECSSKRDIYRVALRALARHYDTPYAGLHVEFASGTLEDHVPHDTPVDDPWRKVCDGLLLAARYRNLAVARIHQSDGVNQRFAVLAVPITEGRDGAIGALALVSSCDDKRVAEARLGELSALVSMVGVMTMASQPASTNTAQNRLGIVKAAGFHSAHEFAFAIANDLKANTGSDQVCLGLVRHHSVTMLCMSGFDNLYPRSPGSRLVVRAMEECLDAGRILYYQADAATDSLTASTGYPLHRRWHQVVGNVPVASIPLLVDGRCEAVLSVRRAANKPFDQESLEKIGAIVAPLAPGLQLVGRASRHPLRLCWDALTQAIKNWLRPGTWGRKAIAALLIGLALWAVLGTKSFVVSVPCELVLTDTRHVAAPFEGTIRVAHVKAGDQVVAGQTLIELDTRELEIRRDKLLAELNIAELQLVQGAMDKDVSSAAQAQSSVRVIRAELEATDYHIARASVHAPEDGVILQGDLSSRIGEAVPLGEPLLELAPSDRWSLELRVPEYAAVYLAAGQTGRFTTDARPDQGQDCCLTRIYPSSEIADGKNVFAADADLSGPVSNWMRAGMHGTARIDAGERPVWWVAFHRVIDSIRLQLWKL